MTKAVSVDMTVPQPLTPGSSPTSCRLVGKQSVAHSTNFRSICRRQLPNCRALGGRPAGETGACVLLRLRRVGCTLVIMQNARSESLALRDHRHCPQWHAERWPAGCRAEDHATRRPKRRRDIPECGALSLASRSHRSGWATARPVLFLRRPNGRDLWSAGLRLSRVATASSPLPYTTQTACNTPAGLLSPLVIPGIHQGPHEATLLLNGLASLRSLANSLNVLL